MVWALQAVLHRYMTRTEVDEELRDEEGGYFLVTLRRSQYSFLAGSLFIAHSLLISYTGIIELLQIPNAAAQTHASHLPILL